MLRARFTARVLVCLLALSSPAGALSLTLRGPTAGPITSGQATEPAVVNDVLTFTVGLDAPVSLNGYDLDISWDAGELAFLSATDLSGLGFDTAPVGATPAGERASAIELAAVATDLLFEVTFQVIAVVADGLVDFAIEANGAGLAPGSLVLENPGGAGIAVPEPGALPLLLLGLAALRRKN